jgi:hypothetical protein
MDKFEVKDIVKRNPVFACEGCTHATHWLATGWVCPVYADPHKTYGIRNFGICPNNKPVAELTAKEKQKIRVGQQKTKSHRR